MTNVYVIAIANSKGGALKTTACQVLASEFVRQLVAPHLIDLDPNQHLSVWAKDVDFPSWEISSENTILDDIERARERDDLSIVMIDVEGSRNMAMAYAIAQADLVIIPTQASDKDAIEVFKVDDFCIKQSKITGKEIRRSVLFTRTSSAFVTNIEKRLIKRFSEMGLDILKTRLSDRQAFVKLSEEGGGRYLHQLTAKDKREKEANNKAVEIANQLAEEVIGKLAIGGNHE